MKKGLQTPREIENFVKYNRNIQSIEEAAEEFTKKHFPSMWQVPIQSFKAGANHQASKMYSEEALHDAFLAGADFDKDALEGGRYYRFTEWFNAHKK